MIGMLTLENAAVAIASLIALSLVSGVLFAVLVQPRRSRVNLWFAVFCFALLLWSVVSLSGPLEGLRFGLLTEQSRAYLLASMIALSAVSLYSFVYAFAEPKGRVFPALAVAAPFVFIAGLLLVWTGNAFTGVASVGDGSTYQLQTLGLIALGAQLAYGLAAFAVIMSGRSMTQALRLPALLMLVAYGSLFVPALLRLPIAIMLATIAAAWMGYVVQRRMMFQPLSAVEDELRVANSDLRQALADFAAIRERVAELESQLAQAGRDRSQFIDNLAIKLRTQLTLLSGYSELLLTGVYGDLSEKQLDRMTKLHRSVLTLNGLIAHMIDLNKIDAGRLNLNVSAFALRRSLDQAVSDVEARRAEKGIPVRVELAPAVPAIRGDEERIRQIFLELLDNAVKFTPAPGPGADPSGLAVTVTGRAIRVINGRAEGLTLPVLGWLAEGDWVVVDVADRGIGIPSGEQARIFDEFSQLNPDSYDGSGLGLAIARRLVDLHEGAIWVKSQPEAGSTFFVALRPDSARRAAVPPSR